MTQIPSLDANRIRKDCLAFSSVDLPITGGNGSSSDNPIVIEDADAARSAYWEWEVIRFITKMRGDEVKFEGTKTFEYEGKQIEQFKISRKDDVDNFYNYYFDVTAALGGEK